MRCEGATLTRRAAIVARLAGEIAQHAPMVPPVKTTTGHAIGAILAGGLARRMGSDKALIEVDGTPMIARVAAALQTAGCEPLVIGRSSAPAGLPAVSDDMAGRAGPAAGLATALRIAAGRTVILVAADQPLLRPDTVQALVALEGDAVVPVDGGVAQATCAVYRAHCLAPLRKLMAERPSLPLQTLLDGVATRRVPPAEWSQWGEDGRSWWSLDSREDVAEAEAWLQLQRTSDTGHRIPDDPGEPS